jgi:gluconolactonase
VDQQASAQAAAPQRYPDPAVRVVDPRFERYRIGSSAVERIATGMRWAEGPVWFGDHHALVWSDIPNNRMCRWDEHTGQVTDFRRPSDNANGSFRGPDGRLVTCEHLTRRVTRTDYDGSVVALMDSYQGRRLNAPNDVVVASDGSVWFTDPGYGILSDYEGRRAELELPTAVYRVDPVTGEGVVVIDDLERPNGLCFSPDESILYVVDSDTPYIYAYDATAAGVVGERRLYADLTRGNSDGIRCDEDGNVWAAAAGGGDDFDGVHVFAPDGTLIGQVLLPEQCANLCFGGPVGNRLFMTASQSIYSVFVNTRGA